MSLLLEGEAELLQQSAAFLVSLGRGNHGDVHTAYAVDLVLLNLVEHGLLGQTEGVVTVTVELLGAEPTEVADTGQRDGNQAVQELPHAA